MNENLTGMKLIRKEAKRARQVMKLAGENSRLRMALDAAPCPPLNSTLPLEWVKKYSEWYIRHRGRALEIV